MGLGFTVAVAVVLCLLKIFGLVGISWWLVVLAAPCIFVLQVLVTVLSTFLVTWFLTK